MAMNDNRKELHVLIVGAGIGGLTLANSLELAGISFTLLEGRDQVAPQVGASIGINPNGARILGQLGCLDQVLAAGSPIDTMHYRYSDGKLFMPPVDAAQLIASRFGIASSFMDRQALLSILYQRLKDKSRVIVNKRVASVTTSDTGVTLDCQDGSVYHGHVLIGCDGVNSIIRREMWRIADEQSPGFIPPADKTALSAEYNCMYGISSDTPGMVQPGTMSIGYDTNVSTLVIVNKGPRIYWFVHKKLDRVYQAHEIPRYSKDDARRFADDFAGFNITPTITFKMMFDNAESYTLVALEEAKHDKWTYDRIACCGDAMHKVTPNAGAGGNACIESAAAIANELKRLVDDHKGVPSKEAIETALLNYQNIRQPRSHAISDSANMLTRIQAMKTIVHKVAVHYIIPYVGDLLLDRVCDTMAGAVKLDFVPPPKVTLRGYQLFNPNSGLGKRESILKRFLFASPLLALFITATMTMDVAAFGPWIAVMIQERLFKTPTFSFPVLDSFSGWEAIDHMWRATTIAFIPSTFSLDPLSRSQMLTFITDFGLVYSLLLIESTRRATALTVFRIVTLVGCLAQLAGAGKLLPLFFFLAYPASQLDTFKARDMRLTSRAYTATVLPAMLLAYHLPFYLSFFAPSLRVRHLANAAWQPFPLVAALLQHVFSTFVHDTLPADRLRAPLADLLAIAWQVGGLALVSAATWAATLLSAPAPLRQVLFPASTDLFLAPDFVAAMRGFLQWDWVFVFAACYVWLALGFRDLKAAGMVRASWAKVVGAAVGLSVLVGPGATVAVGWGVREGCLAWGWHKDAVGETEGMEEEEKKKR